MNGNVLEALAAIWGGARPWPPTRIHNDPLDGIDIEREYDLIQRKASRLSAAQRRAVVARWTRIHNTVYNSLDKNLKID